VVLTNDVMHFHMVHSGETLTKSVDIVNSSAIDALFQVTFREFELCRLPVLPHS
jgi:hypothetical protein